MQFLLGMILDGTNGDTAAEIASVLGYGAGEVDAVNEFCLSMLKQLPELDKKTTLSIANALVVNQDYRKIDGHRMLRAVRRFVVKYVPCVRVGHVPDDDFTGIDLLLFCRRTACRHESHHGQQHGNYLQSHHYQLFYSITLFSY